MKKLEFKKPREQKQSNEKDSILRGKIKNLKLKNVEKIFHLNVNSLLGKILIASLACILIPLVVALVFTLNTSSNTLGKEARDTMTSLASEKQKHLDATFNDLWVLANNSRTDPLVIEFAKELYRTGKPDTAKGKIIADRLEKLKKDYNGKLEHVCYIVGQYQIDGNGGEILKKFEMPQDAASTAKFADSMEVAGNVENAAGTGANNANAGAPGTGTGATGAAPNNAGTGMPGMGTGAAGAAPNNAGAGMPGMDTGATGAGANNANAGAPGMDKGATGAAPDNANAGGQFIVKDVVGILISGDMTVTGRPSYAFNGGVFDESGIPLGQFILASDISVVTKEITANTMKDAKTIVISSLGTVICSQDAAQITKLNFSKAKGDMPAFFKEIKAKNIGTGYFTLNGERNIASYEKVKSQDMYVITYMPVSKYLSKTNSLRTGLIFVIIISFIVFGFVMILLAKRIINPITYATEYVKQIASGDFSCNISQKFANRKDETGVLLSNLNIMKESMKDIIKTVVSESDRLNDSSSVVNRNISELDSEVAYVSSTTVEISSGMTQTAAATQEMYASSTELENAVNSIAEKAEQGAIASHEISDRAQGLKQNALVSQKSANDIRESVENGLKTAIEQTKAVEKINVLTDAILQITAQTNLLALNAAIEAARAGEYGKGFAVVADEIRKLAESSKKAVTEIQNITKLVVSSVANLTESSKQILEFVNSTVIQDYNLMVETGEQYFKDAEFVEDLVTDFSATAEQLSASIQNLVKIVNEISLANSDSAKGTENIAKKAVSVSQKTTEVAKIAMETKESSEELRKVVSKFIV